MDAPGPVNARDRARDEQRAASDPAVSAFVSASAGSGKTKLLTDRILRLMLGGAHPGRIQCLTFTKAAAAEMALRLQARLGRWVTLPDDRLDADLLDLPVAPSDAVRKKARALFADVLDLPGGMRIGTIHAFCQGLLRRFPLEAALSPHFRLVDEADARAALDDARETMLADAGAEAEASLDPLAGLATAGDFGKLVARLGERADRLQPAWALGPERLRAALRQATGADAPDDAAILRQAAAWDAAPLRAALPFALKGSPAVRQKAEAMLAWLGLPTEERAENWNEWLALLLTGEGKPRAESAFCNPKLPDGREAILQAVAAEQARVQAVEDRRRALRVADSTAALLLLSEPVLRDYAGRKAQGGLLDYDDLIGRTSRLLVDPGAAWVLYKLDGGLDHLLLDEVQDTAPAQWEIAGALTEEFFSGLGARDAASLGAPGARRTFFAVGDPKQSIYSFQGADPDAFEHWRDHLRARARRADQPWRDVPLDVSFRSTAPVLSLVDAVFTDGRAAVGVAEGGQALHHYPDRADDAGLVEICPLSPPPFEPVLEPWTVPDRNMGLSSAPQLLADTLAEWIKGQTDGTVPLPSRNRALVPGDVLVLIRRRGQLDRALVRALKARDVPVAGLDRMFLTEQAAVQDLLALLDALLLPTDDLTLAAVLVSPLGGLTDDSLMQLAMDRPGRLWDALRARAPEQPDWAAALRFLEALLRRADHTTPHALLAEALGPLGGRARLFARLGPEAAEPVDELLSAAMAHANAHPPSLQGFLHWIRQSGAEVKREAEGAAAAGRGAVRIMTVHGAKGLQAPLVILPDTTALPPDDGPLVWTEGPDGLALPLWSPRREFRCAAVDQARRAGEARRLAEHNRLLYVALTRAEDRLLVCGWQPRRGAPDDCWYRLVEAGFAALSTEEAPFEAGPWGGTVLRHGSPQRVPPRAAPAAASDIVTAAPLPDWVGAANDWQPRPPPAEPALPRPLAPSRPDDVRLGPVPRAASPVAPRAADRFRRGRIVHALLQHLPALPAAQRHAAALRFAARPGNELSPDEAEAAAQDALRIIAHPALAPLFGPDARAEQPLTGVVGTVTITGQVDRLAVLPDAVWLADYKTSRDPPARAEDAPVLYLRQLAAYRAVLRGAFPDRPVRCALVWTQGAAVMPLPDSLLDAHAPGTAPVPA